MADLTLEQQRALAMASARLRLQEQSPEEQAQPDARVAAVQKFRDKPWGSGAAESAYNAGGTVTDVAAKVLPPEAAAGLGYATNVATEAIPALFGATAGKVAATPLLQSAGQTLMKSALKPTLGMWQKGQGQRAVDTMLNEGLNVTEGGVNALKSKIDALHGQVEDIVANSGKTVDITSINDAFAKLRDKVTHQGSWEADLKTVNDSLKEFLNNPHIKNVVDRSQDVPIEVAQKIKRGTQQSVADSFGKMGSAWDESQKAIARTLRTGIEGAEPAVSPLNAKASDLLNALKVAGRRYMMDENKNPLSLAALTHSPEGFLAHLASGSAAAKSMLARLLYSHGGEIGAAAGAGASLADLQRQQ